MDSLTKYYNSILEFLLESRMILGSELRKLNMDSLEQLKSRNTFSRETYVINNATEDPLAALISEVIDEVLNEKRSKHER